MNLLRTIILTVLLVGPIGSNLSADESKFQAGAAAYEQGNWAGAIDAYSALVGDGAKSPELFYNLGAAHFKNGEPGQAGLWFRRSLVLDPSLAEAQLSLGFLKRKLGVPEADPTWKSRLVKRPKLVLGLSVVTLLLAFLLLLRAAFRSFKGDPFPKVLPFLGLGFLLLLIPLLVMRAMSSEQPEPTSVAVVLNESTVVRSSPHPTGEPVMTVPSASALQILDASPGAWWYLELPDGERGYARAEDLSPLWPPQA